MGYGEPPDQHKSALQQIAEARQRALTALSKVRQLDISTPHTHLAPAPTDGHPSVPILSSQAAVDYLLQLRPYRHSSQNWNIDFGTIVLPKKVKGKPSSRRCGGDHSRRILWICQQPQVPVSNASQLINAVNQTVYYSTNRPPEALPDPNIGNTGSVTVRTDAHGPLNFSDMKTANSVLSGAISPQEAVDLGMTVDEKDEKGEKDGYVPASPFQQTDSDQLSSFKIVLPSDQLLRVVEAADEIAAEMDMLAELEDPDYAPGGGGAV